MRGMDERSGRLFSYVNLEARVPQNHPLRAIRALTNATLAEMSEDFGALYAHTGRPGIAPEKLLRALLLQAFYSIRSERHLMEQLEFNLLFRWFVGLGVDERVWDAMVFTKNRERLLAGEVASRFLARLIGLPAVRRLLSREHFSVDGTLIEGWASIKSFRPIDEEPPGEDDGGDGTDGGGRNRPRDFHGARWSNATHRSTTDADSRLYRKGRGKEAKLSYMGHALMENRDGLVVDGLASRATGAAECLAGEVTVYRAPTRRAIELCRPGGFALQSAWATNSGKRMLRFPTNAAGIAIPEGLAASVDVIHPAADGRSAASGRNLKSGHWGGSRWSLTRGRLLHKRRLADWSTIPGSRDSLSRLHR